MPKARGHDTPTETGADDTAWRVVRDAAQGSSRKFLSREKGSFPANGTDAGYACCGDHLAEHTPPTALCREPEMSTAVHADRTSVKGELCGWGQHPAHHLGPATTPYPFRQATPTARSFGQSPAHTSAALDTSNPSVPDTVPTLDSRDPFFLPLKPTQAGCSQEATAWSVPRALGEMPQQWHQPGPLTHPTAPQRSPLQAGQPPSGPEPKAVTPHGPRNTGDAGLGAGHRPPRHV